MQQIYCIPAKRDPSIEITGKAWKAYAVFIYYVSKFNWIKN